MRRLITLAVASLGLIAGMTMVQQTMARWQDTAAAPAATMTTGTFGLKVGDGATMAESYDWSAMTLSNMKPGDSTSGQLQINNTGSIPIRYKLADLASSNSNLPLTYEASRNSGGGDGWAVLQPGASDTWTIEVGLPADVDNSAQGRTGHAVLTFTGTQVKHVD